VSECFLLSALLVCALLCGWKEEAHKDWPGLFFPPHLSPPLAFLVGRRSFETDGLRNFFGEEEEEEEREVAKQCWAALEKRWRKEGRATTASFLPLFPLRLGATPEVWR
jgi:hypothetical protein